MPDDRHHTDEYFDLPEESESVANQQQQQQQQHATNSELGTKVQHAHDQLLYLKRQQEMIEKQKRELEDLSRKQDELESGRAEMIEKISRSQVTLEREAYESEKRAEQLRAAHASFLNHLEVMESINPARWDSADLNKELSKALSAIDDARNEYTKTASKINATSKSDQEVIDPSTASSSSAYDDFAGEDGAVNFTLWLKRGFAFTLPLIVVVVILAIILAIRA